MSWRTSEGGATDDERVARLEAEVQELKQDVAELKKKFADLFA